MIGEGLMRVNNTLTAQRLTKSLSYQANLRKRRTTRLVLSFASLGIMLCTMIIGALLCYVIVLYMKPVFGTVGPFLESVINGINTYFYASTEVATYKPWSEAIKTAQLNELQKFMNIWMGNIDFSPISQGFSSLGSMFDSWGGIGDAATGAATDVASSTANLIGINGNSSSTDTSALVNAANAVLEVVDQVTESLAGVVG